MKNNILNNIKGILLGMIVLVGVSYVYADWTSPASAPTGSNVGAPVNVLPNAQEKQGSLSVGTFIGWSNSNFMQDVGVSGNVTVNGTGNLSALSGTGERKLCVDASGNVVVCGSAQTQNNYTLGGGYYGFTNQPGGVDFYYHNDSGQHYTIHANPTDSGTSTSPITVPSGNYTYDGVSGASGGNVSDGNGGVKAWGNWNYGCYSWANSSMSLDIGGTFTIDSSNPNAGVVMYCG